MSIIYSDSSERRGPSKIPYENWDACKHYLVHYSNQLLLTFIHRESKDPREKVQASKELKICERKLAFWRRHPRFNSSIVEQEIKKLKSQWKGR